MQTLTTSSESDITDDDCIRSGEEIAHQTCSMRDDFTPFLPLSPATLHILLALAGEDRHGYAIMQEVARQSSGQYKLGPGTLYDNLQKLTELGMIETASRRPSDDDPRRKYYRLTRFGRGVLEADIARLEDVVREARLHMLVPKPRRAT